MFVKIFGSILRSSVWDLDPQSCKLWVTLLAMADEHGFVKGTEGGVAALARLSREETRRALTLFEEPDIESQDQDYGGRRIEKVEGGWMVLNLPKYREIRTHKQLKDAERQKRKRSNDKKIDAVVAAPVRDERDASHPSRAVTAIASASASVSEGRGAGEGSEAPAPIIVGLTDGDEFNTHWTDAHRTAYHAIREKHRDPAGLDELLTDAHAAGWTSQVLGQTLVELRRVGAPVSTTTLIPFAKRVSATPAAPAPSAKGWCTSCTGTAADGHRRGCPFGVVDDMPTRTPAVRIGRVAKVAS
jgi:hypothetical protein